MFLLLLNIRAQVLINPNPHINWRCHAARSDIWPPRQPIGEREALRHAAAIVGSSMRSLRKSQRPWGRLRNYLVHWLLASAVPRQGSVVEEVKGVKYALMPNGKKPAVLRTFWLINRQKHHFWLKSTWQDKLPRHFLRTTLILKFFIT
jgi:hypothetical protein